MNAMKFGPTVLLEIVAIVQEGLSTGTDISQKLRDIEVSSDIVGEKVELSEKYLADRGRSLGPVSRLVG